MGTYVTDTGFVTLTFEENKAYWEGAFQSIFGNDIDLDPEGPIGQMVALFALRDTNLFEAIQEIYTSRDTDQASGTSLDTLYGERGLIRIAESSTFVSDVLVYGDLGTTLLTGVQARQSSGENTDIIYSSTGDVTISASAARDSQLTIQTPAVSEVFSITLDGILYSHTSLTIDPIDVADALVVLLLAGSFQGTVSNEDEVITITQEAEDFTLAYTANITLDLIASATSFQADTAGTYALPANTLDEIVTPQTGWDSINNPNAGETGRATETDSEFRIRAANTLSTGNATEDALVNAISNNVSGVTRVSVSSNRTDVINVDGLPPHSFEVVVSGGLDQDIADAIWETQGGGIASHGNESETVIDSEGIEQTVDFSRPTPQYLWVKVKRDLYAEEDYPADGDDQIKQAIVDWTLTNLPIGKDVIRQRLGTPVYTVPGIDDIEITVDATATPGGTPTYAEQNIAIAGSEYADVDVSRITVEDLTP